MIDTFDSRTLRLTDCYGQRFMRAGAFRYDVVNSAWASISTEYPYTVEVAASEGEEHAMEQHDVTVRLDGNRFRAEPETLRVTAGDLVIWHCPDATKNGFAVVGEKDFFTSVALSNECGFSHAFPAAGDYHWADAMGSGITGLVRVTDPACSTADEYRTWQQQLAEGTLVMIVGDKVEPAEVDIVIGQTVYFAVVKGPGISVTDVRLLDKSSAGSYQPTSAESA